MKMLTVIQWLGPGRKMSPNEAAKCISSEKMMGMVTNLGLTEAIKRLNKYEQAFNDKNVLAVNFRLIFVADIDPLTDHYIEMSGMDLIENFEVD